MSHRILVVDDEPRFRALYTDVLQAAGVHVVQAETADAALACLAAESIDMVVSDVRMPGRSGLDLLSTVRSNTPELPFLLVTAHADVREAVTALKIGAVDYLSKPVDLDELLACVTDALGLATAQSGEDPPPELVAPIVAHSVEMRALLQDAWRIAQSDVNVLITGESGTGKELLAQFIHRCSPRAAGPMVAVNCAALPGTLLSSELFGHERGAFTGATGARKGRFREAEGGVLFLDEIGDMPLELQPVLLRALEERTVMPLGGTGSVPVDFRLIAATNSQLEADVAAGRFRTDLFYRLNVISLSLPPLRDRRDDVVPLARSMLGRSGPHKRLAHATLRALRAHDWPGNIRELENTMQRARLLTRGDVILPASLPPQMRLPERADDAGDPSVGTLRAMEIDALQRALASTGGNRTKAAALLGITRRGLLKKLKRFGLQSPAATPPDT